MRAAARSGRRELRPMAPHRRYWRLTAPRIPSRQPANTKEWSVPNGTVGLHRSFAVPPRHTYRARRFSFPMSTTFAAATAEAWVQAAFVIAYVRTSVFDRQSRLNLP